MSHDLQQRIRALRVAERNIRPDEAWVQATRATLLSEVTRSMPSEPVRSGMQVRHAFRAFVPSQVVQWFRGPVTAVIAMFVLVLGGSVASVSAAERSLPGDFLYSLKLVTEQAQIALASTPDERLKLKLEFTSRRGDELKTVAKADDGQGRTGRVTQAADILKSDLNTVKQQLDEVQGASTPGDAVAAAKLVDQKTTQLVQTLQETKPDLPPDIKVKVTEVQAAAADASVKAIEVLAQKNQESSSTVPEIEVVQALQDHAKTVADVTPATVQVVVTSTVPVMPVTPSSTATTVVLITATGTKAVASLDQAVQQIKLATQDAFEAQQTLEQNEAASSSSSGTTDAASSSSSLSGLGSTTGTDVTASSTSSDSTSASSSVSVPSATSSTGQASLPADSSSSTASASSTASPP